MGGVFYLWFQTSMYMMNATLFQNVLLEISWSDIWRLLCVKFMSEHYDNVLYYNAPCRVFHTCLMSGRFPSNYIDSLAMLGKGTNSYKWRRRNMTWVNKFIAFDYLVEITWFSVANWKRPSVSTIGLCPFICPHVCDIDAIY